MKKTIKIVIDDKEYDAPLRKFKSKKQGYGAYGKQVIDGDRFQIVCNIIKIESDVTKEKPSKKFDSFVEKI